MARTIDMHAHSSAGSACADVSPEEAVESLLRRGCDMLAITDHGNTAAWPLLVAHLGRLRDAYMAPGDAFAVAGVEVSYAPAGPGDRGADIVLLAESPELLAHCRAVMERPERIFPQAPREAWFATWAHPSRGGGYGGGDYHPSLEGDLAPWIDAVEVLNGSCLSRDLRLGQPGQSESFARGVAERLGKLCVAGSDGHSRDSAGYPRVRLSGSVGNARGLFRELRAGRFSLGG